MGNRQSMNQMKYSLAFFLLIALPVIVQGQGLKDTIQIQEVKVLARKKVEEAGLKITRPDSVAMTATITNSLAELISGYSPVFIKSYGRGSAATASFRGTAASHTQIMWNGMNLNSPMRGYADLSLLPVFFADDVYLLHGASSMTEGSGALGGSIQLQNKPDWTKGSAVKTLLEAGSFHTYKLFGRISLGSDKFRSVTRLFYETSENNFLFYNAGVIPNRWDTLQNAAYRKSGILQELYLRSSTQQFHALRIWYQQSRRDLPSLMSYEGAEREEYQDDNQLRLQYEWKNYTNDLNYHFFTGFSSVGLKYFRSTPQFNFINEHTKSNENSLFNHLRIFRKFDEKTYATLSLDANYHQVDVLNFTNDDRNRYNRFETSLYVNIHLKPNDRFSSFFLVRSENYDNHLVPLIPSAGMEWQFMDNKPFLLKVNAARNYHKPSLNDLYWYPGGNPDLLPEDGYNGDISVEAITSGTGWTLKSEFTGFLSKIENWILWQPASNGAYYWEADNVRDVFSRGIEWQVNGSYQVSKLKFGFGGNYSYTHTENLTAEAEIDASRGKQLIYIPKHKGNIYATTQWQDFSLRYDLNYTGKRYTDSGNSDLNFERVLMPYWLSRIVLEKHAGFNFGTINLRFGVENLLNATYQSILWRAMPGRYFTLSLGLNFEKL